MSADPSIIATSRQEQTPITSTPNTTRPLSTGSHRDQPPHVPNPTGTSNANTNTESTAADRQTAAAEERAARLHQAEFDRLAASLISSVSNHISDEDLLAADGANFAAWEDFVEERMRGATGAVAYFNRPARNILHERVGRALILNSVHRSLRRGISRLTSAHNMFIDLHTRFQSVSRAAQVNLYRKLTAFNIAEHATTAEMSTHINDLLDEMSGAGVVFTRDFLAGLVLQNGLHSEPELQDEFNRRVEIDFQTSTEERPAMNFESMVRLVDIIRQQQRFQSTNKDAGKPGPMAMRAEPEIPEPTPQQPAGVPSNLAEHPDNIPDAHDFMAMQAGLCWQCRSPDHLLRDCPMRARPANARGRFRGQPQQPTSQQNRQGAGFQSFYPIVTPPGFTGVYPQTQAPQRNTQQTPPQWTNSSNNRPADYYRPPQYRLQRVNQSQQESVGSQRSNRPSANEAGPTSPPEAESTARMVELGDLTEDLANIRFDHFQAEAPNDPPIVDSATSGNQAYITGEGDLTFSGVNNQRVTIHGVLY
ncbi:hypothetical protein PGT21_050009 [Puccinia graminis f. sp. tritici]|uniref:CCHC-type domain-containing protein n=1 Tax=Puccinia graminis f. sp. tritici TaxID=56615 RepID=A0A5B0PGZ7_PUCGR|nr:hypothetical protein PGTUg99_050206 [Puccinia graminis f. sp. tritici]KAA1099718.1 hypothetical protein PGT21_050009 [Puccinia graminis f. sp. tritici]